MRDDDTIIDSLFDLDSKAVEDYENNNQFDDAAITALDNLTD